MPDSLSDPMSIKHLEGKEGQTIGDRFKLVNCIGVGGFGAVYSSEDLTNGTIVAVKLEHLEFEWASIELEVSVYEALQRTPVSRQAEFFPLMIATGVHENKYRYLAMEMLERSVNHMFKSSPKKLTPRQVAKHAKHLIKALEIMHNVGWIHGDLSLKNILIHNQVTRLVDFGLSNQYVDKTSAHRPLDTDWAYAGTVRFASFRALRSYRPTRRDDMESLAYILVYLIKRKLPWECLDENDEDEWLNIAKMKETMAASDICKGLPTEFATFLDYTRRIEFNERPNYNHFRRLFHDLGERLRAEELAQLQKSPLRKGTLLERMAATKVAASPLKQKVVTVSKGKPTNAVDDEDDALANAIQGMNITATAPAHNDAVIEKPVKKATAPKKITANKNKNCENAAVIHLGTPLKKCMPKFVDLTQDTPEKLSKYQVLSPLRGSKGLHRNVPVMPRVVMKKANGVAAAGRRKKCDETDVQIIARSKPLGRRTMVLRSDVERIH